MNESEQQHLEATEKLRQAIMSSTPPSQPEYIPPKPASGEAVMFGPGREPIAVTPLSPPDAQVFSQLPGPELAAHHSALGKSAPGGTPAPAEAAGASGDGSGSGTPEE